MADAWADWGSGASSKPTATGAPSGAWSDWHASSSASAPASSAPAEPGFGGGGFGAVTKAAGKAGDAATKTVGRAIVQGHKDPIGSILGGLQAPQRGLEALETGANPVKAFMEPKQGPALSRAVKSKIGLAGLEAGPLAGADLPHKLMRGVVDTALDVVNDPMTFAPIGKVGTLIKDVVPGVKPLAEAAGKAISESPLLGSDYYLRGLTPEGKAQYEVITNKAMESVRARKVAEDAIVKKHAAAIRKGVMPDEVAQLFKGPNNTASHDAWRDAFTDPDGKFTFGKGTRPQDVSKALYTNRAPMFKSEAMPELEKGGFFSPPASVGGMRSMGKTDPFALSDEAITNGGQPLIDLQNRLRANVESKMNPPNEIIKGAQKLTRLGNKAFLANPIPHTFNLANLAYNKYGVPTVAKGLVNAGRVAMGKTGGKLGENIDELQSLGAKSQYHNIFDEMGLTRLAGIPGTEGAASLANKALVPLQRASNAAQHKILNSTETGLRAAALDAERKGGTTGAQAAKNIHSTFGTDAPNKITDAAAGIGAPFFHFHGQTAPASALRTLATNPARITNTLKAENDMNASVNPNGPKYRSTVPGANSARMLMDPLSYFMSNLGPLSELNSPYGLKAELLKGPKGVAKVAGDTAARFTPGSQEAQAITELLKHKKGQAGETGLQDLLSSLGGGYWSKH